ncbi:LAMI_0E07910g1_1 [Lachancea mirantina]|uniref:LAMI_0E07910g1_1 n=1 Tax=Lachancea mirantina TaxID=1230905 RepID=A0A1G4JMP4_9SACH|nr:LAMI_0E07910g1_1 [Lachancea mirantina]
MSTLPIVNPFHWGFRGTVDQVFNPDGTVPLKLKNGQELQLHDFISKEVPALADRSQFELNPYLFTGYLQTMYLFGADFSKSNLAFYGREIVNFSDGGISTADWLKSGWESKYGLDKASGKFNREKFAEDASATHPESWPRLHPRTRFLTSPELEETHQSEKPLVVILHGLSGGSHELICRALALQIAQISGGKFDVVVLNSRGCARSKITTRKLFYALFTDDLHEFLSREKKWHPNKKIYTVGFSFGGTILGNYLGQKGSRSLVTAAAILSTPWDLYLSAVKMNDDWWSRKLFSKSIAQFLVRLVKVNMKELEFKDTDEKPKEPPSLEHPSFDVFTADNLKKAYSFKSTAEFDNVFTAPCLGFKTANEYYNACGSIHQLPNVKVPLLIINSKDDPMVGEEAIPFKYSRENKNVTLCVTDLGGHLAYLDRSHNPWAITQIANYFCKFDELVQ